VVKTIPAFAVAHSVALALAVFDVVNVPAAAVEALIALSILLVAKELTLPPGAPPTLTMRYPWAVAFAFGLVHGLGFAGALAEIGLPRHQIVLALVAFNAGVEVGQIAFVAAVMLPLTVLRRATSPTRRARLIPAYAIGALAAAWTIDRLLRFWSPVS